MLGTTSVDKGFVDLSSSIKSLQDSMNKLAVESTNLTYRMGQSEANLGAANARMDRFADSLLSTVESIKKDVNNLAVKVEVMSQKIDSLDVPRTSTRKTEFTPPWCTEYNRILPQKTFFPAGQPFPYWSEYALRCG